MNILREQYKQNSTKPKKNHILRVKNYSYLNTLLKIIFVYFIIGFIYTEGRNIFEQSSHKILSKQFIYFDQLSHVICRKITWSALLSYEVLLFLGQMNKYKYSDWRCQLFTRYCGHWTSQRQIKVGVLNLLLEKCLWVFQRVCWGLISLNAAFLSVFTCLRYILYQVKIYLIEFTFSVNVAGDRLGLLSLHAAFPSFF
jgi:hypothetical protein